MGKLYIEFHRGDCFEYPFQILNDNNERTKLGDQDNLMLSVKRSYNQNKYILQKKLGEGIEWNEEQQCYIAVFEHEDTNDLFKMTGVFDITIVYEGNKPETHTGQFVLLEDVTRNEVE